MAAHYRRLRPTEALPEPFKFNGQHLDLLKASASTQAAGTKRRAARALTKQKRVRPLRSATRAVGSPSVAVDTPVPVDDGDVDVTYAPADVQIEDGGAAAVSDTTSSGDSASDSSDDGGAAAIFTAVGSSNPHHRRTGYSRRIREFMELAASFCTVGSSAHKGDIQKMHEHA